MKKLIDTWAALAALCLMLCTAGVIACSAVKAVVKTADDVAAQLLCGQSKAQAMGISVEDAIELYCNTRPTWEPWLDAVLAARQYGAAVAAGETPPAAGPGCPAGSVSLPAPPSPTPQPETPAQSAPAADAGTQ